jgi:hypothetical protein
MGGQETGRLSTVQFLTSFGQSQTPVYAAGEPGFVSKELNSMAADKAQFTFPTTVSIKDIAALSGENFLAIVFGVNRKPDSLNH